MKYHPERYGYDPNATNAELHPTDDVALIDNFGPDVLKKAKRELRAANVKFVGHVSGDSIALPDAYGLSWLHEFRVEADVFVGVNGGENGLSENGKFVIITTEDFTDHKGKKQRRGDVRTAEGFLGATSKNDAEMILQYVLEQNRDRW